MAGMMVDALVSGLLLMFGLLLNKYNNVVMMGVCVLCLDSGLVLLAKAARGAISLDIK